MKLRWNWMSWMLAGVLLQPAFALAGIEEHNPVPVDEAKLLLELDEYFWSSVDEEANEASRNDPTSGPQSSTMVSNKNGMNAVSSQTPEAHGQIMTRFSSFDGENPFHDDLMDFAELKWRLAAVGIDLLSEEELENWTEELESGSLVGPDGASLEAGGNESTANDTFANRVEGNSDDDDGEDDESSSKTGTLTASGGDWADSEESGGCQSSTNTGAFPLLFLLLGGLAVARRNPSSIDVH